MSFAHRSSLAARWLAVAATLAAPLAGQTFDPLPDYRWSPDGSALAVVERASGGAVGLRVFDGASGRRLASLDAAALKAALGRTPGPGHPAIQVAPRGERLVLIDGEAAVTWETASGAIAAVPELAGHGDNARLSPDGARVAFVRDGDLWSLELDTRVATRLSRGATVGNEITWSPDSRLLVFPTLDKDGLHIEVVDIAEAAPRRLETEDFGIPVAARWRFDAGGVAVVARSPDGTVLELALCQPQRSYCRPLAQRPWSPERPLVDDLRILANGFLWGPSAPPDGALAAWDTLGRQRRILLDSSFHLMGIAAVFAETREVAVVGERAGQIGTVVMTLVDFRGGTPPRDIATGVTWPQVAISESLRAWVRPRKGDDNRFSGYRLERLDGTAILDFDLDGAPVAR